MYGELGIPLKNKKIKRKDEFSQFKTKMFLRTVFMAFCAVFAVIFLYSVVQGNFAEGMTAIIQNIFNTNYTEALAIYNRSFRRYMDLLFILAMLLVFFVVFRIYLNWFTKYFMEINQGMDALVNDETYEVSLSSELSAIEKKINTIKHTLEKQKLAAQNAEQRKNDLIAYLAHDLKTPLASIIGYLNLLHDEKQISDELRQKYLSVSLDKAQRLEDLINEFFEIAKFNMSDITLSYSKINLSRLFQMLLYEFQPILQEKKLNCNIDIADDMMLQCDGDKIERVFDNLLRNAVIYSFEGTDINITVAERNEDIVIRFINHGNTIPKEKLSRIFEQFYRLDVSRSTSGGAGLGLAIAKQIVELHHGTISATSENGIIEFELCLPLRR